MTPVLVLGYGNSLRCDDDVGGRVAAAVAARALPGVEVRRLHQLTPELAAELAGRQLVIFVDASVDAARVTVEPLEPTPGGAASTHHLHPAALLRLAASLGWQPRAAVTVAVPAVDLRVGTTLSPTARTALDEALECVVELCRAAALDACGAGPDPSTGHPARTHRTERPVTCTVTRDTVTEGSRQPAPDQR